MNIDIKKIKSWPFEEAKKLVQRLKNSKKKKCVFETGYGPSGLPHIGTFGEVLRTCMVIKAFRELSKIDAKLIVFSDDMDGLRKVPENLPNKEILEMNLYKPLSSVPDPFEKFNSFAEHNNFRLNEFLKRFDFKYNFHSATDLYRTGFFNNGLKKVLFNYDKIKNIVLPTLGKERRTTYSPFLPICRRTKRVLEVKIEEINTKDSSIIYMDNESKKYQEVSILDGNCKLQWKVDWAMRWFVLEVDYEMNGKDLIESFLLSSKINKVLGGIPPTNLTYELFLDANGEKISKSIGNGISVDDWLKFSPKESLKLFMFQSPKKAKRLFFDVIPKVTDEFIKFKNIYPQQNEIDRFNNPIWFIDDSSFELLPDNLSFNMILNLASVCNAENSNVLWGFVESYYPNMSKKKNIFLNELLEYGVNYYKKFILPKKEYRNPTDQEKKALRVLLERLKSMEAYEPSAVEIQNIIYEIGRINGFQNLRDWFVSFYEVILGQKEGPRLGSFIKFYSIKKTIELMQSRLTY